VFTSQRERSQILLLSLLSFRTCHQSPPRTAFQACQRRKWPANLHSNRTDFLRITIKLEHLTLLISYDFSTRKSQSIWIAPSGRESRATLLFWSLAFKHRRWGPRLIYGYCYLLWFAYSLWKWACLFPLAAWMFLCCLSVLRKDFNPLWVLLSRKLLAVWFPTLWIFELLPRLLRLFLGTGDHDLLIAASPLLSPSNAAGSPVAPRFGQTKDSVLIVGISRSVAADLSALLLSFFHLHLIFSPNSTSHLSLVSYHASWWECPSLLAVQYLLTRGDSHRPT